MELDIVKPRIFDDNLILSGVTKRNLELFPEYGFSISPAKIYSIDEVMKHRLYLAECLELTVINDYCERLKFQKQIHGKEIRIMTSNTMAFHYNEQREHDGMICSEKGIVLCVTIADCCAILIYDPVKKIIAALHSGWKGTMLNIAASGIELLKNKFGTNPNDLLVYLSPAASGDKYIVGIDVAKYFPFSTIYIRDYKFLYDNHKQIKIQLLEKGVIEENIAISGLCTISNLEYHSHRRDGDKAGRMAAFIGMK